MKAPIIVASSTDGTARLLKVLESLSAARGESFVVVQHIAPGSDMLLARRLNDYLSLSVRLGDVVSACAPDSVLMVPGGMEATFRAGEPAVVQLTQTESDTAPSLDAVLESAARTFGADARVVLCFGPEPEQDGAAGCAAVRAAGGRVCVPDVVPPDEVKRAHAAAGQGETVLQGAALLARLLETAPEMEASAEVLSGDKHTRVLIADDEAIAGSMLKRLCARCGWEVDSATSGSEALRLLETGSYDMLLTDYAMPGMDGVALARHAVSAHPGLPVVLISAFVGNHDAQSLADAGIVATLDKPYRFADLQDLLRQIAPAA